LRLPDCYNSDPDKHHFNTRALKSYTACTEEEEAEEEGGAVLEVEVEVVLELRQGDKHPVAAAVHTILPEPIPR
jgi:hypothetical protein